VSKHVDQVVHAICSEVRKHNIAKHQACQTHQTYAYTGNSKKVVSIMGVSFNQFRNRARNSRSGLPMAKSRLGYILEMVGKNKFELPSKKKMAGEIL
jgi:hypothetical protein